MCEPMCFVTLMVTAGADAEADAPGGEEEEEEEEFVVWVRSVSAEDGAYSLPAPRPHLRTSSGTIFDVYRGTVTDLCCFGAASMCSCFVLNTTSSHFCSVFRRFLLGRYNASTNTLGVLQNDLRPATSNPSINASTVVTDSAGEGKVRRLFVWPRLAIPMSGWRLLLLGCCGVFMVCCTPHCYALPALHPLPKSNGWAFVRSMLGTG